MQRDSTHPPFLGPCGVCGKHSRNYTAFSQHLRHKSDDAHQELKTRWHAWRLEYKAILRCRKCGDLSETTDKALKDSKRCPRCEALRQSMSKRQYEKLSFDKKPDPRRMNGDSGSKACWPVGYVPEVEWEVGNPLYEAVVSAIRSGDRVRDTLRALSLPYLAYKTIGECALGVSGYRETLRQRKYEVAHRNREQARSGSKLEQAFVDQLAGIGIEPCARNSWMTLKVAGKSVHREADIKVAVGDGRKIIVLCDGVAFHGPGCMYADPEEKIQEDKVTALALCGMGYTVFRYSGDEIRDGAALRHFQRTMLRLGQHHRIYRNWHPLEEVCYGGKGGS